MSKNEHPAVPQLPTPSRVGQGTAVEQSRAVAQVHAAMLIAQQYPRDVERALAQMRESCQQLALAERAFYRFPRAGSTISGPSIHLARELARCWGNIEYGIVEMRRDDEYGQSEMLAFAWDIQTNTRNSSGFTVPHKRDTKDGPKPLLDMREVYENNANNGARRVREAIFAVLPPWFVEEAKNLCAQTLKHGGGVPLARRIADAIKTYDREGIGVDQLETKLGRSKDRWTEHDVAQLRVIAQSIARGEVTKEDEFPPPAVKAGELATPVKATDLAAADAAAAEQAAEESGD